MGRALHLLPLRIAEQEAVADGGTTERADAQAEADAEQVRELAAQEEAPRVIGEVMAPAVQFALVAQDVVVIARAPEQAVLAALVAAVALPLRHRRSTANRGGGRGKGGGRRMGSGERGLLAVRRRCRCLCLLAQHQLPVGLVGAGLKTADDGAEVLLHSLLDKEDAMQMVGHQLERDGGDLRVMGRDGKPLLLHPLPQRRQLHPGLGSLGRASSLSYQTPEKRAAPLDGHGNQIQAPLPVVMPYPPSVHRRSVLAGMLLMLRILLLGHRLIMQDKGRLRTDGGAAAENLAG